MTRPWYNMSRYGILLRVATDLLTEVSIHVLSPTLIHPQTLYQTPPATSHLYSLLVCIFTSERSWVYILPPSLSSWRMYLDFGSLPSQNTIFYILILELGCTTSPKPRPSIPCFSGWDKDHNLKLHTQTNSLNQAVIFVSKVLELSNFIAYSSPSSSSLFS